MFQSRALDADLTRAQNLSCHASLHGIGGARPHRAGSGAGQSGGQGQVAGVGAVGRASASGGQARRAEIARALLHRPQLLLLDAATAGLDVRARAEVLALLRRLSAEEGVSTLLATPIFDALEPSDPVVVLHAGRVRADTTAAALAGTGGHGHAGNGLPSPDAGRGMTGWGIARRELLRFTRLRERFLAALVRPLVWLFIFAAGFRSVLALRTLRGRGFVLSVEGGEA